jgi:hypothetical protein
MLQFLRENFGEIILLIFMAIWWLGIGFFSIKGDINSFDQKRIAKGMMPMTDDEKLLLKQTYRSSLLNNLIQVIIAGIVALIVVGFIS